MRGYYGSVLTLYEGKTNSFEHFTECYIEFYQSFSSRQFKVERINEKTLQNLRVEQKSRKFPICLIVIKASNVDFKVKETAYLKFKDRRLRIKNDQFLIITPELLNVLGGIYVLGRKRFSCWRLIPDCKRRNVKKFTGELINLLDHDYIFPLTHIKKT